MFSYPEALSVAFPLRSKRPTLKPGEVEVRVEAIGLNFRDVLNVPLPPFNMGKYVFFVYLL